MKINLFVVLMLVFGLFGLAVADEETDNKKENKLLSMDELLQSVKEGRSSDADINAARVKEFKREKARQQQLYADLKAEEKRQEDTSIQREKQFEDNEKNINGLQDRLAERLGSLKELFGVLQQVSSDAQGQFYASLTQLQYQERGDYLAGFSEKMGQTTQLPSIEEIERLWFELHREMTESGKVITLSQNVVTSLGEEKQQNVVRVGTFNIVSNGKYLQFIPDTGRVLEYSRQPSARYMAGAKAFADGDQGVIPFTVDPSRGQLLSLLVAAPNFKERIAQGGVIGYVIISLGVLALLLAIVRMVILTGMQRKIINQIKQPSVISDNPLGRILDEYASHKQRDLETLELKMGEAVMREVPRVNSGLGFLKIIAAVAPLMGLLGTVTGMIITFQSIVLYGAGDPKLMAHGISQALMTTVLGLCVAIPTLLLHNFVQTRAKFITETLEQEAVAIVAAQAEKQHAREEAKA